MKNKQEIDPEVLHASKETLSRSKESGAEIVAETLSKKLKEFTTKTPIRHVLVADWLDTALGPMVAIGDEEELYLLAFIDCHGLEVAIETLCSTLSSSIVAGKTEPILSIEKELGQYLKGQLSEFQTPIQMLGSPFQKEVWEALQDIPLGRTYSYSDLARAIKKPSAVRAVAQACSSNLLAMRIPCHRVIHMNGELGGYNGGVDRKKWLLEHEQSWTKSV